MYMQRKNNFIRAIARIRYHSDFSRNTTYIKGAKKNGSRKTTPCNLYHKIRDRSADDADDV